MDGLNMILIKGKPETQQIVSINEDRKGVYWVRFTNGKTYHLANRDVNILKSPKIISPVDCRITNKMGASFHPLHIWEYNHHFHRYYRIEFNSGEIKEYDENYLNILKSVLANESVRNIFNYLKDVSGVQLIMTENGPISLHDKYEKIDFVGDDTALGCYLNPNLMHVKKKGNEHLLFPFYSNLSQMKAVDNAFKSHIIVIQGPPGTGKTQTILNIISNIVLQGKTVMIVSNNNSATTNVQEKLEKYGLSFIVAPLGSKENKERFIENQPSVPSDITEWKLPKDKNHETEQELQSNLEKLDKVFALQNERAQLLQELQAIKLEWKHFCMDNKMEESKELEKHFSSKQILSIWLQCQATTDQTRLSNSNLFNKLIAYLKWIWMKWACKHKLHINMELRKENLTDIILQLQAMYYLNRQYEISNRIEEIESELSTFDAKALTNDMTRLSLGIFKNSLYRHYHKKKRRTFEDTKAIRRQLK